MRRMIKLVGIAVAALTVASAMLVPASAGKVSIVTINKVVTGPVPAGTTFVVELNCEGTPPAPLITSITFNADGSPATANEVNFPDNDATCTPTETETGGAASVTYACEEEFADPPEDACQANGPQASPITVVLDGKPHDEDPTMTITNTFEEAAPAAVVAPPAAVVAPPSFTG